MTKSKSKSRWQVSQQYVTKIDDSQHETNPSHRIRADQNYQKVFSSQILFLTSLGGVKMN